MLTRLNLILIKSFWVTSWKVSPCNFWPNMDSTLNAIIRIINIYDTVVTWLCSSDWANTCFDLPFPFTTKKITLDLGGHFYTFTEKRAQKCHESLWRAIEMIIFKVNNDHQVRYEIAVAILHYKWVLTRPFFADNVQEADRRMCRSHSTMIKHKKITNRFGEITVAKYEKKI